jgi:hypothetical protein
VIETAMARESEIERDSRKATKTGPVHSVMVFDHFLNLNPVRSLREAVMVFQTKQTPIKLKLDAVSDSTQCC